MKLSDYRKFTYHLLLISSVVFAVTMVNASTTRKLSDLEGTLFQVVTLGLSIVWGYQLAKHQPQPHAKSAFRRIVGLYKSLARIQTHVQQAPMIYNVNDEGKLAFRMLENIVVEQIATAEDAQADWREMLTPEEIKEILGDTTPAQEPQGQ